MAILDNLEPVNVFKYFEEICAIPRSSGKEKAISDYLVNFANNQGLEVVQDKIYNVIIKKPATKGYENHDAIILQAHIDMVCVADNEDEIDFDKDGITPYIDGDFVKAKGTTLGADDGIGIAYIMAVLADETIAHPALECVFTTSEEVGLDGAKGIDTSTLRGKKLINLDSEEENFIVVGCAGGARCDITKEYSVEKVKGIAYDINISGLCGGHSGTEIDKGGANANILLGRILYDLCEKIDYSLVSMQGGTKDNAICVQAKSRIIINKKDKDKFKNYIKELNIILKSEYAKTDPDLEISINELGKIWGKGIKKKDFRKLICMHNVLPNGVQKMSQAIEGLVETSLNMGVVRIDEGKACISYAVRSNSGYEMTGLTNKLMFIASAFGADISFRGDYPAWESRGVSDFAKKVASKYTEMFSKQIDIITIHAGLECGVFYSKMPYIDAISIGPDVIGAHTTDEAVSISSVNRIWKLLVEILKL